MHEFIGKEVQIYFNLNKKVWSIKSKVNGKWRVVGYCKYAVVAPSRIAVGEKSRQRVIREGQKNVHAYIQGTLVQVEMMHDYDCNEVSYNPYKYGFFYRTKDDSPIDANSYKYLYFDYNTKKCYGSQHS